MRHLLVTNDFPPKVGGIQSYLWELWRRLPADDVTVVTTASTDATSFDDRQPFRIVRMPDKVLLPTRSTLARVERLVAETASALVVVDPALPVGLIGPRLSVPYVIVMHGSELLGRLPVGSQLMGRVVRSASGVIAAGRYPASEARRVGGAHTPPIVDVPPGIDARRLRPLTADERADARDRFGLPRDATVVLGLSRLVRRKGFDVLIRAASRLGGHHRDLAVAIAGAGRDGPRLARMAESAPVEVRMLGRVADDALPSLYACADVFAMLCHDRWLGLEKEGFGIVFLEAAACGVPQLAGDSGGAADAVLHGATGLVVSTPRDVDAVAGDLDRLLGDRALRSEMGLAARKRAEHEFDYDVLAARVADALESAAST